MILQIIQSICLVITVSSSIYVIFKINSTTTNKPFEKPMCNIKDDMREAIAWVKEEKLKRKKEEFREALRDLIEDEKREPNNRVTAVSGWSQFIHFCLKYEPKE